MGLIERDRWLPLLVGLLVGAAVLFVGVMLLTTWEVEQFRATTFEHDFTGLVCGVPFDNPGWETGSPCHGAVSRQTGIGLMVTSAGLLLAVGGTVKAIGQIRTTRPDG
jgi:hypothetical protein